MAAESEEKCMVVNLEESTSYETEKTLTKIKEESRRARGDCEVSESTSHTQFFKKSRHEPVYKRITTDEFFGISESISSSETFHCIHGKAGKQYTQKGLLKRNLKKELDPIKRNPKWTDNCKPTIGWELVETTEFLVQDATVDVQRERLEMHLKDLNVLSKNGYRVDVLDRMCNIFDYLVESLSKDPTLFKPLSALLENMEKPILLNKNSDIVTHFENIRNYFGFMGYLLLRLESDELFDLVSKAIIFHLSASDTMRPKGSAHLQPCLRAATPMLIQSVVRMIAVSTSHRFPAFATLALLLACDTKENCLELMKENIVENIFYRFNPYFPDRRLKTYEVNPADPQDINVKLGDSTVNFQITLSLLLVLLRTTMQYIDEDPKYRVTLPCPDWYSQRCFIWAYRYECRARHHRHQRVTLTVIAHALLYCFKRRLLIFSTLLMPDVMTLSVLTELPPKRDWTDKVSFEVCQNDVLFKKLLIGLSMDFLKIFSENHFLVESCHWLLGLVYLIDPGLSSLRFKWTPSLYTEIRKTSLQALVCTLHLMPAEWTRSYGLVRRVMWFIEWYSMNPFELHTLYWCVRLLHVAINNRYSINRGSTIEDLFDTHGIIILMHLCYTLLEKKLPPVEKSQVIISLCLRLLTSSIQSKCKVSCCVYPNLKWPHSIGDLSKKILDIAIYSLERHFIISDRFLIAMLNFVWEGVIWKPKHRVKFIKNDGIYKLLDLITMTKPPVQCLAMALICDATRAGDAVGQLVTWRANLSASNTSPNLVQRGATIATLLAAIFRDELKANGVRLDYNGVIEDLDLPIMSTELREQIENVEALKMKSKKTPVCYVACDVAGSRLSKAFAILHMLSEDLKSKVALADEAYNLYKNIELAPEDETILVLCSNYLTLKLNEVWVETDIQSVGLLQQDNDILNEFLQIGKGWAADLKKQQNDILQKDRKKNYEEEYSLYAFLGRVRLNIALDALRQVRCVARSADRSRITNVLLHDAVHAHHRRSLSAKKMEAPVLRTYGPKLDHDNVTGQFVKVRSIVDRKMPDPRQVMPS